MYVTLQRGDPVQLLPWLYLGSSWHASRRSRLTQLGVTALLNVAADDLPPATNDDDLKPNSTACPLACMSLPIVDNCTADIASWFPDCFNFIGNYTCLFTKCQSYKVGIAKSHNKTQNRINRDKRKEMLCNVNTTRNTYCMLLSRTGMEHFCTVCIHTFIVIVL